MGLSCCIRLEGCKQPFDSYWRAVLKAAVLMHFVACQVCTSLTNGVIDGVLSRQHSTVACSLTVY